MNKFLLISGLLVYSLCFGQKISADASFKKCTDSKISECELFENTLVTNRLKKLVGQKRMQSIVNSIQTEGRFQNDCNYEKEIGKQQCYMQSISFGNGVNGLTKFILFYNTDSKKIDVYWKQGREWMILHEDSHIPDKLIYFSKLFLNQ